MAATIIGRLAVLAFFALTASCTTLDAVERELVFRPNTEDWAGYSPSILGEEQVWIPVGDGSGRLNGWWL